MYVYIFVGEVCEPGFCLKLVVSVSKYGLGNMLFFPSLKTKALSLPLLFPIALNILLCLWWFHLQFLFLPLQQFGISKKLQIQRRKRKKSLLQVSTVNAVTCKELLSWSLFCEPWRWCPALPLVLLCNSYRVGTISFLARFYCCYQMVAHFLTKWICHIEMS